MPRFLGIQLKAGIFQKGLFIVLLPLLINSFLILLLNGSLDRAAQLLESSRRHSIVVNTLSRDLYTITGALISGSNAIMNGAYNYFRPVVETNLGTIERDLAEISSKVPMDISFERTRLEMLSLISAQRAAIAGREDVSMAADALVVKLRRTSKWIRLCGKESQLLNKSLETAQSNFQQSVQMQHREQLVTGEIVLATLLSNLVLACLLAVFFHRHIAGRVGTLVRMARKMPTNEALTENIGGEDELSELALELGKVSMELSQIEEYRKTLMQMMAHDVRSPIMGAEVSVDVLAQSSGERLSAKGSKVLDRARDSVATCLNLVNDLLLLESIDSGTLELDKDFYDISALAEVVGKRVRQIASAKGVAIDNKVESELIDLDHDRIAVVLERMLLSAIERSEKGSAVVVTGERDGKDFRVCVNDLGKALSEEEGERLFDRLYQAGLENSGAQPGLGLAAAVPIIAMHGGTFGCVAGCGVIAGAVATAGARAGTSASGNQLWFSLPREQAAPITGIPGE